MASKRRTSPKAFTRVIGSDQNIIPNKNGITSENEPKILVNAIGPKKGAQKRKNFSCEGCPSASLCGKVSCAENAEIVADVEESAKDISASEIEKKED